MKITYVIVKEKSLVVCKITHKCKYGTFTSIGKAMCNPDDTFDETTGRRIAESRAKLKLFKQLYRYANYNRTIAMKYLREAARLSIKYNTAYARESEHNKKLLTEL